MERVTFEKPVTRNWNYSSFEWRTYIPAYCLPFYIFFIFILFWGLGGGTRNQISAFRASSPDFQSFSM